MRRLRGRGDKVITLDGVPKLGSLSLTRDGVCRYVYTLPSGSTFPRGSYGTLRFTDSAGGGYCEPVDGDISDDMRSITFWLEPEVVNAVPAGANFEVFVSVNDYDYKVRYGRVARAEASYPLVPAQNSSNYALQFSDSFERDYVGNYWIPRSSANAVKIHNNPFSIPNTLGPNYAFFKEAAVLWYAPLNTDSATINVTMRYVGDGKCTVVLCSDYSMKSWLGLQFSTGLFIDRVKVVRGTGPTTFVDAPGQVSVNNLIENDDNYVIKYNDQSRTIACYKNSDLSPLIQWTDGDDVVLNGPGYRYTGFVWNTALLTPGAEPSEWSAKDGV